MKGLWILIRCIIYYYNFFLTATHPPMTTLWEPKIE
jgi:hypothetical protein